ncbi:DUF397 domain-containing protein [Micromonospora sp. DH14]|uniref:DUF397 domain-containing protein n=1 Tax=Micromonospora sp. DH14 TaxID=3040120 RepID=UPI00244213CE|nr:DUF397 domain-containing protein [Micromonospora sp. DH14]MDG9677868.1 DUF397 domain-containing protein [Micromonospora sp. DH14]
MRSPTCRRRPVDSQWRKSTRSGGNGACVEVRRDGQAAEVRDSKDQLGPTLRFDAAAWSTFLSELKR